MTLNRADFPEMTDEQWTAINAEADRRATEASQTAKKGLLTETDAEARVRAAIEAERAKLEADEAGKLEIQRNELAAQESKLNADRRSLAATKKLMAADVPDDKIEALLPLFTGVDDSVLESTIDTFVTLHKESVKAQVDAAKQGLLNSATPPTVTGNPPTDAQHTAQELANGGNSVGAVDALLAEAGYNV